MKRELLDMLVCPMCKGKAELDVAEENGLEITSGSLYRPVCMISYSIRDTIPKMLPPKLHDQSGV